MLNFWKVTNLLAVKLMLCLTLAYLLWMYIGWWVSFNKAVLILNLVSFTNINCILPVFSTEGASDATYSQQVHSKSFNVGVQALMLLYQLLTRNNAVSDRLYRALYSVLLSPGLSKSSKVWMCMILYLMIWQSFRHFLPMYVLVMIDWLNNIILVFKTGFFFLFMAYICFLTVVYLWFNRIWCMWLVLHHLYLNPFFIFT